jgi:hypothetical protein
LFREPSENKIGPAVLTIAFVAATALLALAMAWLIGSAVQRHLKADSAIPRCMQTLASRQ